MRIVLIGMSGCGKSARAMLLEKEKGFLRFCCDDFIEQGLSKGFKRLGYRGIRDVSRWMGQPYQSRYQKNSRRYLELEEQGLRRALELMRQIPDDRDVVIDATGSVVYMPQDLLASLRSQAVVIYLQTPENIVEEMIKKYYTDPKPVIWGDIFCQLPGEERAQAIRHCYPHLLNYRKRLYEKLAHFKINCYVRQDRKIKADDLLNKITAGLERRKR